MAGPSGTTSRLLLPFPTPDDDVDAPRDIKALADKLDEVGLIPTAIPVGAIMMWALGSAPAGWLLCDGTAVSDTYPKLKALMTNVPDLRTRVPVGQGTGRALGAVGGEANHVLSVAELPSHRHPDAGESDFTGFLGDSGVITNWVLPSSTSGRHIGVADVTGYAGGNGGHNNMPPFVVVNFIICAA